MGGRDGGDDLRQRSNTIQQNLTHVGNRRLGRSTQRKRVEWTCAQRVKKNDLCRGGVSLTPFRRVLNANLSNPSPRGCHLDISGPYECTRPNTVHSM